MKKFIYIFLCFILISLSLVLPCFAIREPDFYGATNLLYTSTFIDGMVYNNPDRSVYIGGTSFTKVNLRPNTTYTFFATQGSDVFYCGPVSGSFTTNNDTVNIGYTEPSINYLYLNNGSETKNGMTFTFDKLTGSITLNGTTGSSATVYYLTGYFIPSGRYYFKTFGSTNLNGSWLYMSYTNEQAGTSGGDYGTGSWFTSNGNTYTIAITVGANRTLNNVVLYPGIYSEEVTEFELGYSDVYYSDTFTSVYTFTTPGRLSNYYMLGTSDPSSFYDSPYKFSINGIRDNPDNKYYLVEGSYTYDELLEMANSGYLDSYYQDGYSDGYKKGEFDGLSGSNFLRSLLLTIVSLPLTFVSQALNFDFLGINIFNIIQILLTLLIIAFAITHLKGRE